MARRPLRNEASADWTRSWGVGGTTTQTSFIRGRGFFGSETHSPKKNVDPTFG